MSSPALPRRVAFKTLGCKLNQAETESIATEFKTLGWQVVAFGDPADALIVNSCTVTNSADRKTRSAMNQALRIAGQTQTAAPAVSDITGSSRQISQEPAFNHFPAEADEPLVVMAGCYVDSHRDKLEADGKTYSVGNGQKSRIPQMVDAHFRGELLPGFEENTRDPFGYPLAEPVFRTRAMVKIQDGCDNFCTFCIIPFVRGRAISRPISDTVKAVEDAAAGGFREIVLTGVNMSRWEEGGADFADLVQACLNAPGDFRLRLGSIEPDRIDTRLLDLTTHAKFAPHMHLCLQSGSEKILLSMRRQYTAAEFMRIAEELRGRVPGFNITTDIIVGFPGESEDDFADTVAACERIKFGHIHTFPYSRRSGTRADRMTGHIPGVIKKERGEIIRAVSERTKREYRESLAGTVQSVLVEKAEKRSDGSVTVRGLSASYVPVRFSVLHRGSPEELENQLFSVRIHGVDAGDDPDLIGEVVARRGGEACS